MSQIPEYFDLISYSWLFKCPVILQGVGKSESKHLVTVAAEVAAEVAVEVALLSPALQCPAAQFHHRMEFAHCLPVPLGAIICDKFSQDFPRRVVGKDFLQVLQGNASPRKHRFVSWFWFCIWEYLQIPFAERLLFCYNFITILLCAPIIPRSKPHPQSDNIWRCPG